MNNSNWLPFILLLLFGLNSISAQVTEYSFSEFLFPDLNRQTFQITPFINFNQSSYNSLNRNTELTGSITGHFNSINFTRDKQSTTTISGNIGLQDRNADNILNYNKVSTFFDYRRNNRIYINDNQFINLAFTFDADLTKRASDSNRRIQFNTRITPTIGNGRIEVVTDVWHGIALVNNLKERGLLKKQVNSEDVTALGHKIAAIKNSRRVDFRHEEILERELLIDYFDESNLIDINEYRSIISLLDSWEFEDFTIRKHGRTIEYGFDLEYDIIDQSVFSDGQRFNSEALTIIFTSNKAKSLKTQIDHKLTTRGGFWNLSPFNNFETIKKNFYQIEYKFNYGYYFSARTNFSIGAELSSQNFLKSSETNSNASLDLRYNYYMSPHFVFTIRGAAFIDTQDIEYLVFTDVDRTNFSVRLNYFVY